MKNEKKSKQVIIQRLKCTSNYFVEVLDRKKEFEVRVDDGRNFTINDLYILEEIGTHSKEYTGRYIIFKSSYILKDFNGLKKNYVAIAISNILNCLYDYDKSDKGPNFGLPVQ